MAAINPPSSSSISAASISSPISPPSTPSPPRESTAAFVPFLWEEKPGISKSAAADSNLSPPQKSQPLHLFIGDLGILPLPAPPRLQKPSNAEGSHSPAKNRDEQKRSIAESLSKRWQGRKARTEDDPFLVAMQACRIDGSKRQSSSRTLLQRLFENEDEASSRFSSSPRTKSPRFLSDPSATTTIKSSTLAWGRLLSLDETSCASLKHRPQEGVYRDVTQHASSPQMHSAHQPPTLLQTSSVPASRGALIPIPSLPPDKKPITTSKRSHAPKAIQHHKRMSGGHDKLLLAGCLGCRNVESDDNTTRPQWAL